MIIAGVPYLDQRHPLYHPLEEVQVADWPPLLGWRGSVEKGAEGEPSLDGATCEVGVASWG